MSRKNHNYTSTVSLISFIDLTILDFCFLKVYFAENQRILEEKEYFW